MTRRTYTRNLTPGQALVGCVFAIVLVLLAFALGGALIALAVNTLFAAGWGIGQGMAAAFLLSVVGSVIARR